ncbi:MAG: hypothetical protein ACM3X3_05005 [Betaproteobacteria bacterium]
MNTLAVATHTSEDVLGAGWRPLLGSAIAAPIMKGLYQALSQCALNDVVAVAGAILGGIMAYGSALTFLGEFGYREIATVPVVGDYLARALIRSGIIRR